MFSNKQLVKLIIPLIIEQILTVTVGMADVLMVAQAGEAAVSGVSLVDTLNVLFINIFAALATGGAVVSAQYLGHKDEKSACKAAGQLLITAAVLSIVVMIISLLGNHTILRLIYGRIDSEVMNNAIIYFYITAISFPFLAFYNSSAALFRAMGNSKVSMMVSLIMNAINVIGNAILVFGFHMGVVGVAIPTLISRMVAAIIMLILIHRKEHPIHLDNIFHLGFNLFMIKRILSIGIPNSLENSMFQIGKILVQGLIASFGIVAISANAVANNLASIGNIPGVAIGLAMITIIGQSVGANDFKQAKAYTKKLMKVTYIAMFFLNILIAVTAKPMISLYNLSPQTSSIALQLVLYTNISCIIFWPTSFALPNALRAANDVKYTMVVSIISMWIWRIGFSFVLAKFFGLGVLGVWIAMYIDWVFRGGCFVWRFLSGKWKEKAFHF